MSLKKKQAIEIETLQPSEIVEASVLLSRAYNASPLFGVTLGGPSEKQRSTLQTGFKTMLKKKGRVFSAKEGWKDPWSYAYSGMASMPEGIQIFRGLESFAGFLGASWQSTSDTQVVFNLGKA